jgi:DNA-binding response OmpR family regulator
MPPPDIVLLGANWNPRALLRAQLIEHGFDVVATDAWPMMRRHLRGEKPRLAIVDLQDLDGPMEVLRALRDLIKPDRVLVLTALGTAAPREIEALGFRAIARPIAIDDVVAAAAQLLRDAA